MTSTIEDHLVRLEIEDFLWEEADLLDEHQYQEWLDLFTEDARYIMPIRRNVPSNDDKKILEKRVQQLLTHAHWAEEPLSRVTHMVSNVRILGWNGPDEVRVKCRFMFYRNRHADEESTFIGKRVDTLRRVDGKWMIARREIYLDESVLLHKNLTNFF